MIYKERLEHEADMTMGVTCDPGLDPGPERGHQIDNWQIVNRACILDGIIVSMLISPF